MRGGPRLGGRRDEDDRLRAASQSIFERPAPSSRVGAEDEGFGFPVPGFEQVEQTLADRFWSRTVLGRHHDHQDFAVGDRVAFSGGV